jgi:hypothetical protein
MLVTISKFHETQRREGRTFLVGLNGITFTVEPCKNLQAKKGLG